MPTEQQVMTAALDTINSALPPHVRAYEPRAVPDPRPSEHLVVTVVRRSGGSSRAGRVTVSGWSVYVMAASRTSATNARNSLERANGALENRTLTVAGVASTPIRFDNARAVAPDDGWLTGVRTYTFAI